MNATANNNLNATTGISNATTDTRWSATTWTAEDDVTLPELVTKKIAEREENRKWNINVVSAKITVTHS